FVAKGHKIPILWGLILGYQSFFATDSKLLLCSALRNNFRKIAKRFPKSHLRQNLYAKGLFLIFFSSFLIFYLVKICFNSETILVLPETEMVFIFSAIFSIYSISFNLNNI